MPREYKPWIFTKSCDFAADGILALGQILADKKDPASTLQPGGPLEIKDDMKVEFTMRENLNMQTNDEESGLFRAWLKFGIVPANLKINMSTNRSHDYVWHCEKLESYKTSPSLAYVTKALEHGDVAATVMKKLFKKRLYMVTGVRVAKGTRMRRRDQASTNLAVDLQTTTLGQSATPGTEIQRADRRLDAEDFDKSSDFVFAYRLNEVRYRGIISHKPYNRGETSSADGPVANTESEVVWDGIEPLQLVELALKDDKDFEKIDIPGFQDIECYVATAGAA